MRHTNSTRLLVLSAGLVGWSCSPQSPGEGRGHGEQVEASHAALGADSGAAPGEDPLLLVEGEPCESIIASGRLRLGRCPRDILKDIQSRCADSHR